MYIEQETKTVDGIFKRRHPGEIILEKFLLSLNISAYRLAKGVEIQQTRFSKIIKGNRRITADTALRFSKYFGTTVKFWLGIQDAFDIEEELSIKGILIQSLKNFSLNIAYRRPTKVVLQ